MKILMKDEKEMQRTMMNKFLKNPFLDTFENREELENYLNLIQENKNVFIEVLNEKSSKSMNEDSPLVAVGGYSIITFGISLFLNLILSCLRIFYLWPITPVSLAVFILDLCYLEIKNTIKTELYIRKLKTKLKDLDQPKALDKTLERIHQIDSKDSKNKDAYFEQVSNLIIVIQDLKYDGYLNDISKLFSLLDKYVNLKKAHNLNIHDLSLLNPKSEFIIEFINIEQKVNGIKQNLDMQQSLEDLDDYITKNNSLTRSL